jgi:hypothetical protein
MLPEQLKLLLEKLLKVKLNKNLKLFLEILYIHLHHHLQLHPNYQNKIHLLHHHLLLLNNLLKLNLLDYLHKIHKMFLVL